MSLFVILPLSLLHLNSGPRHSSCADTRDGAIVPSVLLFQTLPSPFFSTGSHSLCNRHPNLACLLSLWHCPSVGQAFLLLPQTHLAGSFFFPVVHVHTTASNSFPHILRRGVYTVHYQAPGVCPLLSPECFSLILLLCLQFWCLCSLPALLPMGLLLPDLVLRWAF